MNYRHTRWEPSYSRLVKDLTDMVERKTKMGAFLQDPPYSRLVKDLTDMVQRKTSFLLKKSTPNIGGLQATTSHRHKAAEALWIS